jgi:hypothetical protein
VFVGVYRIKKLTRSTPCFRPSIKITTSGFERKIIRAVGPECNVPNLRDELPLSGPKWLQKLHAELFFLSSCGIICDFAGWQVMIFNPTLILTQIPRVKNYHLHCQWQNWGEEKERERARENFPGHHKGNFTALLEIKRRKRLENKKLTQGLFYRGRKLKVETRQVQ